MKTLAALLFVLSAATAAQAQDFDAERRRIRDERAQLNAAYEAEQKGCYGRFAVNDCLDAARQRRTAAVTSLRRQEVLLNDAERKRRAAERLRELDERRAAHGEHAAQQAGSAAPEPQPAATAQKPRGSPRAQRAFDGPKLTPGEAVHNERAFEARRRQAESHKAQVLERNAKRGKAPAADLPAPP